MVQQDYMMRQIKELVRTLLKLLFHLDMEQPSAELLDQAEDKSKLQELFHMVDAGNINEAENQIYEMTADTGLGDRKGLKIALLFYAYLNDKNNDFLEQHDFSREEISQGMERLVIQNGLASMADTFLPHR